MTKLLLLVMALPIAYAHEHDITSYAWYPQAPSLSVKAGVSTVIPVKPCPKGITRTLRLFNGDGIPETVRISGGTCTPGAVFGTLDFTPVNSHTGTWKIGPASAGIEEAISSAEAAGGGVVKIPPGVYEIYGPNPVQIVGSSVHIIGSGKGVSILNLRGFSTQNFISFDGPWTQQFNTISGLDIRCEPAQTSGFAIAVNEQNFFKASQLRIANCSSGISLTNANLSEVVDARIEDLEDVTGVGIFVTGSNTFAMRIERIITGNGKGMPYAGIQVQQAGDILISASHFITVAFGLLINPQFGQVVASIDGQTSYFDNTGISGLAIVPGFGGSVVRNRFHQCWFSSAVDGPGVLITSELGGYVDGISFVGAQVYLNGHNGMTVAGGSGVLKNVRVFDSVFAENSLRSPGTYHGVVFNSSDWMFSHNRSGPVDGFQNTQGYGLAVYATTNDRYTVIGNDLSGNKLGGLAGASSESARRIVALNLTE